MHGLAYDGSMNRTVLSVAREVDEIRASGFAFVDGGRMDALLANVRASSEWMEFTESWNGLATDTYLAKVGAHRKRRHSVFSLLRNGRSKLEPHQAHFQSKTYNALQGGLERWFEPIEPVIANGTVLATVLEFCAEIFGALAPRITAWRAEVHQFRIEASSGTDGSPTPEGIHRDGVDYVLVLLIARKNIAEGTTTIHEADGALLGSFTLTDPLDAALVDDARVFHGVTNVQAIDAALPAYRDVLVVTLRKADP